MIAEEPIEDDYGKRHRKPRDDSEEKDCSKAAENVGDSVLDRKSVV